ncbi:hypothetical protein TNCV_2143491 [Trichonephila clavipes]|nr:hypothetical protein TNCV_2143491 [Trichonephila clavipes]
MKCYAVRQRGILECSHVGQRLPQMIVMTRRLETSIFKTARLVDFLRYAVFSLCVKWINDGKTAAGAKLLNAQASSKEKDFGDYLA